jgi:hypothetical protein
VGSAEPVQLVDDKQSKDSDRDWIVRDLRSQKAGYQPKLDGAMAQKIDCSEIARAHRKMLSRLKKVVSDQIARVFKELLSRYVLGQSEQELLRDKICADTRHNLSDGKRAFHDEANLERKMYVFAFKKPALHLWLANMPGSRRRRRS